jgi:hypothetical protein
MDSDKRYLPDKIMTWYNKKPSLHKCINEVLHISHELFHRFGLSFYIEDASTKSAEHLRFSDVLIHNERYFM